VNRPYYIGMISGTSRDGADAALVSFQDNNPEVKAAVCIPYPADLARTLDRLVTSGRRPSDMECKALDTRLAEHFSGAVSQLLHKAQVSEQQIAGIGSHGQTVWHDPDGPHPESIQLGDPRQIARQTGIVTVGDFRRADMDAGGQGAPLAPLLHQDLFPPSAASGTRVVLNLGGIANISVIRGDGTVSGYDTGPANCLMDAWVGKHQGESFDPDGRWAAQGQQIPELLNTLLADPYFQRPAPKSTGIEYFNLGWLSKFDTGTRNTAADVQPTLAELTAVSVARAILPLAPEDVLVCGGGSHNIHLLSRLQAHLPCVPVKSTAEFGLDPDWIEAVLFAWLARERLAQRKVDTRQITGAGRRIMLGVVTQPLT
jgi:anhydro-N-acetylmuramic acid kinase